MKFLNTPKFWKTKNNFLSILLVPISIIYFFLFTIQKKLKQLMIKKFNIKIICIGNINIGGTGKTPLTKLIYDALSKKHKCCTIKKYRLEHIDEINYLNEHSKLVSKKSRIESIKIAEKKGYEVAIMDDGLQDYSFEKDLNIICIKSNFGFGNERMLPAGPLREPLSKLKNCQIIIINGERKINLENSIKKMNSSIKIFHSKYQIKNVQNYINRKFLVFSGISDNESFFDLLKKNNIQVCFAKKFPDHYKFTQKDIKNLLNLANKEKAELLTTEKNYYGLSPKLSKKIEFVRLELNIKNHEKFINEIY